MTYIDLLRGLALSKLLFAPLYLVSVYYGLPAQLWSLLVILACRPIVPPYILRSTLVYVVTLFKTLGNAA